MNFFKFVHDWELDSESSLFNVLLTVRLGQGEKDKFCWNPSKRLSFKVKTFYNVLHNVESSLPSKSIWRSKAHLRGLSSLKQHP
jgi:hypothetical protein